jgi:hypothetical protein
MGQGEKGKKGEMSNKERLDQIEASHVRLMTEHELEVRRNDKAWKRHRRWLREYREQLKVDEEKWRATDARFADLGDRIEQLVSGIGAFIAAQGKK